jgi:hypothetical protein
LLTRPENIVHFFRDIHQVTPISKEVLRQRTDDYHRWVEAFAKKRQIPMEWAEKGVRKEDYVRPHLRRMERKNQFGVYFILRYDLHKLKAHALRERDGHRYACRLTDKGIRVALMFLLFHQRVCRPLANSLFHRTPTQLHTPASKLQAAYEKADASIQQVIDLLAA